MIDVLVVGGGVSGLVCARDLHDRGLDVAVVEASDRLGGRVHTWREPGEEPVELGGQWVALGHHRLRALLASHGLSLRRPPRRGRVIHVDEEGRVALPAWRAVLGRLSPLEVLDLAVATTRLGIRARREPTVADVSVSAASWLARTCRTSAARHLLGAHLEAGACLPAEDVSLGWVVDQLRRCDGFSGLGDTEHEVVVGGLGALVDSLAAPLRVDLARPALRLRQAGTAGQVVTDGGTIAARQIVLATPPACTDRLTGTTRVPPRRPGAVLKVVARYLRPFWREAGFSGLATNHSASAVLTGTVDAGRADPRSPGVLVGFATGAAARRLSTRPGDDQRRDVLDDLARFYGPAAREPLDLVVHDWAQERWTPGGYTWPVPPGGLLTRSPVRGVHLAGSEQADSWPGFVEGAVCAGHAASAAARSSLE